MDLSELLTLLQHEIQKSYDFVEEITRSEEDEDRAVLHIALEKVEIELPIILKEEYQTFDPEKIRDLPLPARRLIVPYKPQWTKKRAYVPEEKYRGKIISAKLVNATEKIDREMDKEKIGRIKVVLKPILE
jgi:hypothetical protein